MTLPQNVADAVKLPIAVERCMVIMDSHADAMAAWQTIRAHLMSQEAEVKRLNAWIAEYCKANRKAFLADQYRLAAANALLRECHCYFEARGVDSRTIGESLSLNEKIQSHLQGAGDEG